MAADLPQCSCGDSAAKAWERISQMEEIGLDTIILATTQTIDFSLAFKNCAAHNSETAMNVKETLLRIYSRLLEFIEQSLDTYARTKIPRSLSTTDSDFNPHHPYLELGGQAQKSGRWQNVVQEQESSTPSVSGISCVPLAMALGEHKLDEQESKYLALAVLLRTLKNVTSVLQQMGEGETVDIRTVDAKLLAILLQSTKLAENVSATIHSLALD
jgi:hypothetical protein